MQRTGTGRHVKQAERAIRTMKDKCRATKFSLGWTLPRSLHQHLIVDVVQSMNVLIVHHLLLTFLFQDLVRTTSTTILSPSEPFAS